jgi:dihydrofolate reductase
MRARELPRGAEFTVSRPHVVLYIAASLDGFIARRDGAFDWLDFVDRPGEDYGYHAFYESVDAIAMGRGTYDICAGFPTWPYPEKPSVVFTSRTDLVPRDGVEFVSGPAAPVIDRLGARGHTRVWLAGGGVLARQFQAEGILDEYVVSTLPIIIGEGLPLFPTRWHEESLVLAGSRAFESGLVQCTWVTRTATRAVRATP